ncbi:MULTISPECIES: hypothetical protein [unclassified Micromonospora]
MIVLVTVLAVPVWLRRITASGNRLIIKNKPGRSVSHHRLLGQADHRPS